MKFKTMKLKKTWVVLTFLAMALNLTGCEETEDEAIAAAQACLNEMNSSLSASQLATKAAECRSLLGTPVSEKGFIIECSSYFLEEGFFGSQIIEAFSRIDDNQENDVLNVVSTFAFNDTENADDAANSCAQTGSTTFEVFGNLAKTATTIGNLGGLSFENGEIPTIEEFETALANITDSDDLAAVGETIVTLADSLCDSGSEDLEEDVCPTLDSVTSSNDNETIGICIKDCMEGDAVCSVDATITCN